MIHTNAERNQRSFYWTDDNKNAHSQLVSELLEDEERSWPWLLPIGLLIFALISVPVMIFDADGLPRFRALKEELRETKVQNEKLQYEVVELQHKVDALRKDPRAIEKIARDELGMIREGEVVFVLRE